MDPATLIILVLLLLIVAIPVITSLRLSKSTTQRSTSPAPATGNSTATPSASSGGGSAQKGKSIPSWIIPLGIAYLVIRGLFIIWRNYITPLDWIAIVLISFFAILNFWNGKNRWLSLVLIVAIGCIIWFNQAHIDSFKQQSASPTEQSAGQEQVATAPATVEEIPSTERVVVAGRKITLTGDGTYSVPAGKKSLCFENLGMKDGSSMKSQYLTINGLEYSALGTKCHSLPDDLNGKISVELFNGKSRDRVKKIYDYWRSQPGGQAEWPIIRIGE